MKYKKKKNILITQGCRSSFDSRLARQHIVEFWSRRRLDNTQPLPVCWSEASDWFIHSLLDRETKSLLGFFSSFSSLIGLLWLSDLRRLKLGSPFDVKYFNFHLFFIHSRLWSPAGISLNALRCVNNSYILKLKAFPFFFFLFFGFHATLTFILIY